MSLSIRIATEKDIPIIHQLVSELAVYEREPDAVTATMADYQKFGFGPQAYFETLIAEWNGEPCGFALYFFTFSTWKGRPTLYLEDLFVRESARGHGIGKALLQRLAAEAVKRDCARLDWQVLNWNAPAIAFYQSIGAKVLKEWLSCRVEGAALEKLATNI